MNHSPTGTLQERRVFVLGPHLECSFELFRLFLISFQSSCSSTLSAVASYFSFCYCPSQLEAATHF